MSRKRTAPFHHHSSQTENFKARRLDSLILQSVICLCVCEGEGGGSGDWLMCLLNAAPHLFVAFHDYSVSTALKDARLDEVFV